ncbi:MAG: DUF4349 domain-containing protein [Jiangellaceae bacterium]
MLTWLRRGPGIAAVLLAGMLLTACAGGDDDGADDATSTAAQGGGAVDQDAAESAPGGSADEGDPVAVARIDPSPRQIIHVVDLTVEVDDVGAQAQRAATLAETSGGFVAAESTDGDDRATLTLRVPSDGHTEVVARLEELGQVRERHRSAEDVTDEIVDVDARIASQRRSIDRIRVLLDQASDLDDVVRIESELARREADRDSLLQRQEQLAGLTSLATVTVTFVSTDEAPADESDLGFLSGLRGGWDAFVEVARVSAAIVGAVLPFAITAAVVGVPAWLALRRRRPTAPPPAA